MALLPYTERSFRLCFAPFAFYRSLREFDSAPCQSSFAVRQRTPSDQISGDKFLKVVLVDFLVGDHFRIDLDQQSGFLVVVRINSTLIATPFTKKRVFEDLLQRVLSTISKGSFTDTSGGGFHNNSWCREGNEHDVCLRRSAVYGGRLLIPDAAEADDDVPGGKRFRLQKENIWLCWISTCINHFYIRQNTYR